MEIYLIMIPTYESNVCQRMLVTMKQFLASPHTPNNPSSRASAPNTTLLQASIFPPIVSIFKMGCTSSQEVYNPVTTKTTDMNPIAFDTTGRMSHDDSDTLERIRDKYFVPYELLSDMHASSIFPQTSTASLRDKRVLVTYVDTTASPKPVAQAQSRIVDEIFLISRTHHSSIVEFVGFSVTDALGPVCIVEDTQGGTLRELLGSSTSLTWAHPKLAFAVDVCSALAYLHTLKPGIVHGNVRSANVHLNKSHTRAKLSLSQRHRSFAMNEHTPLTDLAWCAPEVLFDADDNCDKQDIYSFGALLCEMDSNSRPFDLVKTSKANFVNKLMTGELQLTVTANCPPSIAAIVDLCLQPDPVLRPPASKLLAMLKTAQSKFLQ